MESSALTEGARPQWYAHGYNRPELYRLAAAMGWLPRRLRLSLARRLGRAGSKGCIRIPEAMDVFLDRHGILDANYEQAAQHNPRFQAVLLPDRTPSPLAGNALVVIDSSQQPSPTARLSQQRIFR